MALIGSLIIGLSARTEDFERGLQRGRREIAQTQQASGALSLAFTRLGTALGGAALGTAALGALRGEIGRILQAGTDLNKLRSSFDAITGSTEGTRKAFGFARDTADRLGLSLQPVAEGLQGIAAATRGTNLEGAQTQQIFTGITTAAAALRLSADDTKGVLNAVQQSLSKGVVSSEELRGQIGERLPGAFAAAARSIGVTTEELSKLLEKGSLNNAFWVKFSQQLLTEYAPAAQKAATAGAGAFARLSNEALILRDRLAQEILPQLAKMAEAAAAILKGRNTAAAAERTQADETIARVTNRPVAQFNDADSAELRAIVERRSALEREQRAGLGDDETQLILRRQVEQLDERARAIANRAFAADAATDTGSLIGGGDQSLQLGRYSARIKAIADLDVKARASIEATKAAITQLNKEAALTPGLIDKSAKSIELQTKGAEALRAIVLDRDKLDLRTPADITTGLKAMEQGVLSTKAAIEAKAETERDTDRLAKEAAATQKRASEETVKGLKDQQEAQESVRQSLRDSYDVLVLTEAQQRRNKLEREGQADDPETQRLLERLELQEQIRRNTEADRALQQAVDADIERTTQRDQRAQTALTKQLTKAELRKQDREQRRDLKELETTVGDFADYFSDVIVSATDLGKRSFKDFADSVIQDLLRISARQFLAPQLSKLLESGVNVAISLLSTAGSIATPTATGAGLTFQPAPTIGSDPTVGVFSGLPIGARAEGGPVMPNAFYRVGEHGEEILATGSTSGRIIPNSSLRGGGGNTFIFNGVTDAGSFRRSQNEIRLFLANATRGEV